MFNTLYMGLTAWDLGDDPYDHSQLANNFVAIDQHDHSSGKGVQIPSAGLKDRSVTTIKIALQAVTSAELSDNSVSNAKLQDNSVGANEIIDGSVGTNEIANGAVTAAKIDPNFLPVGSVIMWGRPDALPSGDWEVMDGRPWSSITNTMGYSTGNIPDMRNRVPLGSVNAGSGTTPADPPATGATGGSHTKNVDHTHTGGAHTHPVPDHTHSISSQAGHTHQFLDDSGNPHDARSRTVGIPTADGFRQALFVPGLQATDTGAGSSVVGPLTTTASHNHGGATGGATGLNTGSGGNVATTGPSVDLTAVDVRPRFTGLMFIMRVR
jgi:hypothetical protein